MKITTIKWTFLLSIFLSCSETVKQKEFNKNLQFKKTTVKPDTIVQQIKKITPIFKKIKIENIHGARTSSQLSSKEIKYFNVDSSEKLWVNFLSFNKSCSAKPFCARAVFSIKNSKGKSVPFRLFELTTYSNELIISDSLKIGSQISKLKTLFNVKLVGDGDGYYYLIENEIALFIKFDKNTEIINGIRIGMYNFSKDMDTLAFVKNLIRSF